MTSDFQFVFLPLDIVKRSKHKKFQASKLMQSDIWALWGNACFFLQNFRPSAAPPPLTLALARYVITKLAFL